MSNQRSLYYEYTHRPISTRIDEEPYETENPIQEAKTARVKSTMREDLEFAEKLRHLPEMPDMVKSMAKQYVESHQPKSGVRHVHAQVIKSLGTGTSDSLQSRNQIEQTIFNRSFSHKKIHGTSQPKLTARVSELPSSQFESLDQQYSQSQCNYNKKPTLNINIKQALTGSQSTIQSNRLSPLPQKYKEYLPNIIKKKINDATSQSFNFNPKDGQKIRQKNIEYIQGQVKSDVSYLKESQSKLQGHQSSQPTILTTGDKAQDDLIETTLGYKNYGKSLIDLPQNLEELLDMMKTYDKKLFGMARTDQEERMYEQYLHDNFRPLDMLNKNDSIKELPNLELKQYVNNHQQSRYLQAQSTKNQASVQLFNHSSKMDIQQLEKQPPKISTRPEQLSLIQNKIMKKFGEQVFLKEEGQPARKKKLDDGKRQRLLESLTQPQSQNESQTYLDERKSNSHSRSPQKHMKNSKIQNLASLLGQSTSSSQLNLGNPTSRQDALLLINWFERMLKSIQSDLPTDQRTDNMFPLLQLVMNICVKELTRQVSVQCLERGLLIHKVFDAYTKLVELINKDHRVKRKKLKHDMAEKLDRYINVLEDQIKGYQEQVAEYQVSHERMKSELDDYLWKLKSGSNLIQKFKKKCYNAQKDFEGVQRKIKFLEKENQDLKQKVQEYAEKLGEEVSEIDESEKRRLMYKVEQELADEQLEHMLKNDLSQEDIDQIPDKQIIQEEERGTDMIGFDYYLSLLNADRCKDGDTQTEKVTRRHIKLGVVASKLGIMKDKETYIDVRMFQGEGTVTYRYINQQPDQIKVVDQEELQEDDSSEEEDSEEEDEDDTLQEIAVHVMDYEGQGTQTKKRRKRKIMQSMSNKLSLHHDVIPDDMTEEEMRKLPQYGTEEAHNILSARKQSEPLDLIYDEEHLPNQSMSSQVQMDEPQRKKTKAKQATLMELFATRIKQRIKDLVNSGDFEDLSLQSPEFCQKLKTELVHTSKEIQQMNGEMVKKDKQVRFQVKQSKKKDQGLKSANEQVDTLEMDNYYLREQIADLMKQLEEYKALVQELLKLLDQQSLGPLTINELRKHLVTLIDKIYQTQQKMQQNSLQEEEIIMHMNESSRANPNNQSVGTETNHTAQINKDLVEDRVIGKKITTTNLEELNDSQELPGKPSNKIMSNLGPKYSSKQTKSVATGSKQEQNMKKRAMTRFQQFNIGIGKKKLSPQRNRGTHPGYLILRKIQSKDKKKIKDVMPRKMLLRVIYQVYNERGVFDNPSQLTQAQLTTHNNQTQMALSQATFLSSSQINGQNAQTTLIEWLYDNFMQKYGLKNVAERKFIQVISSCIMLQDQLHRIKLFGRFIEAYDDLPPSDYNKYIEISEMFSLQILNFKVEDDMDSILLPANRAIDYYKQKFEMRYLSHDFVKKLREIDKKKVAVSKEDIKLQKHLKGNREAVDFDWFVEFVIDSFINLQEERESQIRDIYLAVDVNNDGIMSLSEFQMLMKVFHFKSAQEIWRLFDEYAENGVDPQNPIVKYLNLEQFTKLALEKEYFTFKAQYSFSRSKDIDKDFLRVQDNLADISTLFKSRLIAVEMNEDFEYLELLDNFQTCIKYPFSPRVGWLCFRIVDEIFKRIYLKKISDTYMPVELKKAGMKLRPSQSLINSLPLNFFDTMQ